MRLSRTDRSAGNEKPEYRVTSWLDTRRLRAPGATATGYSAERHIGMTRDALFLVRLYYAASLVLTFLLVEDVWALTLSDPAIDPRWPVAWLQPGWARGASMVLLVVTMGASVLAALNHERRWIRALFALALLQTTALQFSFGFTNHFFHIWLWIGTCFVFLPSASHAAIIAARRLRYETLRVFAWTTVLILLFYTLSGIAKFAGAIPLDADSLSSLAPTGLAHHVVARMLVTQEVTVMGQVLAEFPALGWPAFLAVIYIELFAIVALFRPVLLPLFGAFLMLFHMGIWMFMGIGFWFQPLQVLMFLVWSPFRPAQWSLARALHALPLLGGTAYWASHRQSVSLWSAWVRFELPVLVLIAALSFVALLPYVIK